MSVSNTVHVLNRLLAIHQSSFLMYQTYARPFVRGGDQPAVESLKQMVADQQLISGRIIAALEAEGGQAGGSEFPMRFTGQHDLAMGYLLRCAVEYQRSDIEAIEACVADRSPAPVAKSLAEEALGLARGHLASLQELIAPTPH